jgi:hypothetical protein
MTKDPDWWRIGLEAPLENEERVVAELSGYGLDALEIIESETPGSIRIHYYAVPSERAAIEEVLRGIAGTSLVPAAPIFREGWAGELIEIPTRSGRTISIEPGFAFGQGEHATTRAAIKLIEETVAGGETVLDVGCGTGILGLVALASGARAVDAIDLSEDARRATRANAALNGARELSVLDVPLDAISGRYDVVLANILAPVLIAIARDLSERATSRIILSGILESDVQRVAASFPEWNVASRADEEGWSALLLLPSRRASHT